MLLIRRSLEGNITKTPTPNTEAALLLAPFQFGIEAERVGLDTMRVLPVTQDRPSNATDVLKQESTK